MKRNHLERSPKTYISEIILFIDKIESFTRDLSREDFLNDQIRIYAVDDLIRNIGEAVRVLAKTSKFKNLFYRYHIPYDNLSNMRSSLTHEYFALDVELLWSTATDVLPNLKPQFKKALEELK